MFSNIYLKGMLTVLIISTINSCKNPEQFIQIGEGVRPRAGFVPDSETAIKIAIIVLTSIYGEKEVESEKPYHAVLENGIWSVYGTLPKNFVGGVRVIRIRKSDGKILYTYSTC